MTANGRSSNLCSRAPVLSLFDPGRTTKLSTDASNDGIGEALWQLCNGLWRPVAYASRSLSYSETRYVQIEEQQLELV